jgi:hypothetical protein
VKINVEFIHNERKLFNYENGNRDKNYNLLRYFLYSVNVISFCAVLGIYLRSKIPVANGKE